jgi:hypothetical protein
MCIRPSRSSCGRMADGWPLLRPPSVMFQLGELPAKLKGNLLNQPYSRQPRTAALMGIAYILTAERQKAGRKLLLWVGPGVIGSGAYPEPTDPADRQDIFDKIYWFSTLLREARVTLYTFSVGDNNPGISSQPGYWGLRDPWEGFLSGVKSTDQATAMDLYKKVLAVESGGRAPLTENDLGKQMDACLQEASTFYTLTFDPPLARHAAEYHDLKVEVREAGLTARTMTGYYDEPFYDDAANPEIRRVTAAELEQIAGSARGESDGEVQVEADLKGFVPLKRSDIMVSYGPVAIRGKMYILPVRSVHIWRKRTVPVLEEWHAGFNTWEPYTTMLNQFTFEDYHMFRVESRLLTGSSTPIAPGSTTPP